MTPTEKPEDKRSWMIYGISALLLFILLVLASVAASGQSHGGKMAKLTNEITQIDTAILSYKAEYNTWPIAPNNASLIREMTGDNPRRVEFITLYSSLRNASGEMLDPWGTPFRITFDSDSQVHVISAGPDKIFGTADDIANQ